MFSCIVGFTLFSFGLFRFLKLIQVFFSFSPPKVDYQLNVINKNIKNLLDSYYQTGISGLRTSLPFKRIPPVWQLIIKQMEINLPIEDIKALLRHDVFIVKSQINGYIKTLSIISAASPSIGVLGTVIGLIKLLRDMKDVSNIGSNMSLALMTTLYGIFVGTIFLQPIISRLESIKDAYLASYEQVFFFLDLIEDKKPAFYLEENQIDSKNKKRKT